MVSDRRSKRHPKEAAGEALPIPAVQSAAEWDAERLILAAQATQDGFWDWDLRTGTVWLSPGWKAQLGYEDHELPDLQETWDALILPEDRERTKLLIAGCREGGAARFEIMQRYRHKAGHLVFLLSRAIAVRDDQGRLIRLVGTHTDITALKRMEDELRCANTRLEVLVEEVNDGTWDLDVASGHLRMSDRMVAMLGYEPGELPNHVDVLQRLMHPDDFDRINQVTSAIFQRERDSFRSQSRFFHKSGEIRHILCIGKAILDETGQVNRIVGSHIDMTDSVHRERLLEELAYRYEQQREAAEAASRAKTVFMTNMGHELRTPLNAIIGFSDYLMKTEGLPESAHDCLKQIHQSGLQLLDKYNSIIEYADIEARAYALSPDTFDMAREMALCVEAEKPFAEIMNIAIEIDIPYRTLAFHGDRRAIRRIIKNIVGNAIKYGRPGGHVWTRLEMNGHTALIHVEDDGIGIPESALELIGQPFMQLEDHPARRHNGLGLGLAIVTALVGLHQGTVHVIRNARGGTTVTIHLPQPGSQTVSPP